jgi:hypothetical protein
MESFSVSLARVEAHSIIHCKRVLLMRLKKNRVLKGKRTTIQTKNTQNNINIQRIRMFKTKNINYKINYS